MAVLSAPFAVLACICAALPLLSPSEAARLPGGRSVGTHSPAYSSPQTRNPFLDGSTPAHEHNSEDNAHRPAHRDPPLLRRFRAHDHHTQVHHHDRDPHDRAHEKAPRSAFARSRYRRGPLDRRSSVYVSGEHGDTYLVSRTSHQHGHKHVGAGSNEQPSHTRNARQVDESDLAMGRIDIMVATQSAGGTQRLASLTVDASPIDWTPSSDQSSVKAFPLNVSTTNQTQFMMMPIDDSYTGTLNRHVALATGVFDAGRTEMVMYCATYNPDPGMPSALVMTPCTDTVQSDSDVADPCADAASSNPHQSQVFSYDPFSGKIEPISAAESASSGVGRSSTDDAVPASCAAANVRRGDVGNATTTTGRSAMGPSATHSAPTANPSQQQARNVTLVYVAGAPELAASPSPPSSGASTTTGAGGGASAGQPVVFTTTITTTVVATVTTSGTTSRTVTPAKDAASVPAPSTPSPSTTAPTFSGTTPSATATATSTTARSASNLSSTTSTTSAAAHESLEIEVVGVTPPTTTSSSSTSATIPATTAQPTTTTVTTTTTSSHGSASPTLDPMAVASMIESQTADQRRAVVIRGFSNQ